MEQEKKPVKDMLSIENLSLWSLLPSTLAHSDLFLLSAPCSFIDFFK
jgi:hypothetical protein